jgi:hypothetical protein
LTYWLRQVGRALSRLANAVAGGEGDCTLSAWSWEMHRLGSRIGTVRVVVIDRINRDPGHCHTAWLWHDERGLLDRD